LVQALQQQVLLQALVLGHVVVVVLWRIGQCCCCHVLLNDLLPLDPVQPPAARHKLQRCG
jgi:hypothetical protein